MQNKVPLIIAAVLGVIAIFFANSYLKQREKEVAAQARLLKEGKIEEVLTAREDIAKGTLIEEKMLALEKMPSKFIQPRAANSIDRVVGKFAVAPIAKGEQVLLNKIAVSVQEFTSLSYRIPPTKRAITIPVDSISSVGGMIKPGDSVDILSVVPQTSQIEDKQVTNLATVPLFQKVLVLAVGSDIGTGLSASKDREKEKERVSASTITIALTLKEATMLAFVQEQGKLRFVLRPSTDSETPVIQPANWDTLFMYLFPEEAQAKMHAMKAEEEQKAMQADGKKAGTKGFIEEVGPPPAQVEIYHGSQREVVPLQK